MATSAPLTLRVKSDVDGRWARRLAALYAGRLDWAYLRSRAVDPGERTARPRDPEQEALLTEADRRRIAESELLAKARRVPPP